VLTNWGIQGDSLAGCIDEVAVIGGDPVTGYGIPRGGYVSFRGWLVNVAGGPQPDEVNIAVGTSPREQRLTGLLGLPRPDVASQSPGGVVDCGFFGAGAITAPCGTQPVVVTARTGSTVVHLACAGTVDVVPTLDPLQGLTFRDGGVSASIDGFYAGDDRVDQQANGMAIVPFDRPVSLRLWCVDRRSGTPPLAVVARLGGSYLSVIDGVERPDVVRHLELSEAVRPGFLVPVFAPHAGTGTIEMFAILEDGTYARIPAVRFRAPDAATTQVLPTHAQIRGMVDEARVADREFAGTSAIEAGRGQTVFIRGWAFDLVGPRVSGGIEAEIDGVVVAEARRGNPRADIARESGNSAVSDSEFIVEIDTRTLPPRRYTLSLWALSARSDARSLFASRSLIVRPNENIAI
jgi:hypothetical protein